MSHNATAAPTDASKKSVLVVHNRYRFRGGEDVVFENEASLLVSNGHRVRRFVVDNADLPESFGPTRGLRIAADTVWSRKAESALRHAIRQFRPDIVHAHNTFPQLSPSIYEACASEGVPIVQTLHNYRLICPVATLLRDERPCEDCVGRLLPWPGMLHGCYQGSRTKSAVVVAMLTFHNARHTWNLVSVFVALSEFSRRLFVKGGLPADKIFVKPNFLDPDPGASGGSGRGFLFVGRLSAEKGIATLLDAWRYLPEDVVLRIIGDGPLRSQVEDAAAKSANVQFDGLLTRDEVLRALSSARALVVPSICYENSPLSTIEAFACGVPVIASRIGALEETIEPGRNGLLFEVASPEDLIEKVEWLHSRESEAAGMGQAARADYLTRYTGQQNYRELMRIYRQAVAK